MIKQNKINININKDDQNINDFLLVWSEIGFRPSKIVIYKNFEANNFLNYINPIIIEKAIQKDIIPFDAVDMVNERNFCKIGDNIWISFATYDVLNEESFIGEVVFYYDLKSDVEVQSHIELICEFEVKDDLKNNPTSNLYTVFVGQSGFELEPVSIDNDKYENYDLFYNDQVLKKVDKLSKKITKSKKGLSVIFGERGTGKTSLIKYICNKITSKDFIFIPTTLFDSSINNSEFRNFIKKYKNSVIVLDDCEIYFSDLYSKSNIFTNNLLQLVDGLDSDELCLNLILVLNCDNENDIDSHLMESNNLLDVIHIDYLKKEKISELSKHLEKKTKFKSPTKLIDVLKNKPTSGNNSDLGFN
jgi:hypothetical protein